MTEKTKAALTGSFKNAVSTLCGVVLSNLIDPETFIFTPKWGRHVATVAVVLILVNEARYWKTWADNPSEKTSTVIAFFLSFFVSMIFQILVRASGY